MAFSTFEPISSSVGLNCAHKLDTLQNEIRRLTFSRMGLLGMSAFTHFDAAGNAVMVDVSEKEVTSRTATARGAVVMSAGTLEMIVSGGHKKGDVLGIARLAGIMGAKRTSDLIPLCHPLGLSKVSVDLTPDHAAGRIEIEATAKVTGQTGVEMEALTAVSVAALTVYDMCKAVDKGMRIEDIRLVFKEGGRSGRFESS